MQKTFHYVEVVLKYFLLFVKANKANKMINILPEFAKTSRIFFEKILDVDLSSIFVKVLLKARPSRFLGQRWFCCWRRHICVNQKHTKLKYAAVRMSFALKLLVNYVYYEFNYEIEAI